MGALDFLHTFVIIPTIVHIRGETKMYDTIDQDNLQGAYFVVRYGMLYHWRWL
jgi:membrane protein CcdC involved in cytochrome C biogenesis